jgi:hypothetical protein
MKKLRLLALLVLGLVLVTNVVSAQGISQLPGGGWWSGEQVQNVGTAAANVVIDAYHESDSTKDLQASQSVDPGGAFTFTPFTGLDKMEDGWRGSAVVSANQPIKAIVNVTNLAVGGIGATGGKAAAQYQGFDGSAVAKTLYFPLAKGDYYGATTTYYVQNAGDAAATFVATFNMNDGNSYTYTSPSVQPNRMAIFSVFDATGYDAGTAQGGDVRLGSLTVTSAADMAGVVMEHSTTDATATFLFGTRGFTDSDFDSKAYAPVAKNSYYGQFTGIQVQNVDSSAITITVTYKVTDGPNKGTTVSESASAAPGKSYTFVQLDATGSPMAAGDLAAATIEATGNFVAIVNEQQMAGVATPVGITYSAMPDGAATQKISVPLYKDAYFKNSSGLQIQNVGSAAASVTAEFACTQEDGTTTFTADTTAATVDPGSALLIFSPSVATNPGGDLFDAGEFKSDSNCSVTINADQNIVAIVNEMGVEGNAMDNNNYEGFNLQ